MNIIAVIHADLRLTSLGTRSRLADDLLGVPVLRRTVERVSRARKLNGVYVLCSQDQGKPIRELLKGTKAVVRACDADPPPWTALVRSARKWSLDSWRGGIGGTTCFDEFTDGRLLDALAGAEGAEAVLSVPAAAAVIDPDLIDRMIDHRATTKEDSRLTFTQAPPGLSGLLLNIELLRELAAKAIPIGWVFGYKPDTPQKDLIFQPCCLEVPPEVRYASGRLIADTERSLTTVQALLTAYRDPDARTAGRWLIERERTHVDDWPREIEIELTTEDPYPNALLHSRGNRLERRGVLDLALLEQIAQETARMDDTLVVFGGFGDPLRYPELASALRCFRSAPGASDTRSRVFGLCVKTSVVDLSDAHIEALIENEVDILNVSLDAWTPELYQALQSPNERSADLTTVLGRLDRLTQMRQAHKSARPILIPELAKARENVHELDDFHDGWIRKAGAVCISGVSNHAGQSDDHRVMSMAPPRRSGCRRLRSRCLILADGRVTMCDQDFRGLHTVGDLHEQTLGEIWRGSALTKLREAHREERFDFNPLCGACDEWHRP